MRIERLAASDIEGAREIVREYVLSLSIDLAFQGIDRELEDFPSVYAEPEGSFLVAKDGNRIVGCAGLKKLEDGICEMKRLYVLDEYKGQGIGKRLVSRILEEGAAKGYRKIRLDTLRQMDAAQGLYRSLGFHEIPAYVFNPIEGAVFMERDIG